MSIPGAAHPMLLAAVAEQAAYSIPRSLRFNSGDSSHLSKNFSAGNRKKWTWAGWVKRSALGSAYKMIFSAGSVSTECSLRFTNSPADALELYQYSGGGFNWQLVTTQVFRDPSAWYHIVVVVDSTQATSSNRAKLYVNGVQVTAFGTASYPSPDYDSLVNSTVEHGIGRVSASQYFDGHLADIHFIDGYALDPSYFGQTNATTGVWDPIVYTGSYGSQGWHLDFADNSNNTASTLGKDTSGNNNNWSPQNLSVYQGPTQGVNLRDSAKITLSGGRTGGTNTALLVNGVLSYNNTFYGNPNANGAYIDFSTSGLTIGSTVYIRYWNAAEGAGQTITATCDQRNSGGTQIAGTAIAQTWNQGEKWNDGTGYITQTLQSGVSTIRLTFSNNSDTGLGWGVGEIEFLDGSGNDSLIDTPTNGSQTDTGLGGEVVGNYATLNPLEKGTNVTLSNGNLEATNSVAQNDLVKSTIGMSSGKWYAEFLVVSQNSPNATPRIGLSPRSAPVTNDDFGNAANEYAFGLTNNSSLYGRVYNNGSWNGTATAVYPNDIAMCAFDADTGKMWFGVNGTWFNSGNPAAGTNAWFTASMTEPYFFTVHNISTSTVCNFGQRPFAYTAPSGYKALCTANLPAPTIAKGSDYFDVSLYTGNGSTQTISGLNFEPDLVWWKNRTNGTIWHNLVDQVRGAGKKLFSNDTAAENTINLRGDLTAFTSTGFTMTAGSSDADNANATSVPYVAWCWDAGSSTVSNTAGSITSTVRANASAGFSVVTYTGNGTSGATIGHGLGVAPEFFIVKCRNTAATGWLVFAKPLGATSFLQLESTAAVASNATAWNNTAPSSTTITLGNSSFSNGNTQTYVCYAFAPVAGYSSFGSYTSNNSADGPFVYTDFKIRFLLVKLSSSAGNPWLIFDSARSTYNVVGNKLAPNSSVAEDDASIGTSTQNTVDFLSNGFKLRTSNEGTNGPTNTYIYAAFAEHPFAYARAR